MEKQEKKLRDTNSIFTPIWAEELGLLQPVSIVVKVPHYFLFIGNGL
jgi:hypothetical protein